MKKIFQWFSVIAVMLLNGCKSDPGIPAVTGFQLDRYLGKWYEAARLPNRFERGMSRVYAEYTMLDNGTVHVLNCGIKNGKPVTISGYARLSDDPETGDLEVSFFRPFYSMYRIIKLAPDYSYSIVTGSSRDYLWVSSRKPELTSAEQAEIIAFLQKHQFPVKDLLWSWQDE
jgi:apolipoprotein D and lipocalin family protein